MVYKNIQVQHLIFCCTM